MPSPRSVAELFLDRVQASGPRTAFTYPSGSDWKSLSWSQTGERVRAIASGLRALGVQDEERCAILSSTRVEWLLADLAILCAGAATTTVYSASSPEECGFILRDSETRVVFAEDAEQVAKLENQRDSLPGVVAVVVIDGQPSADGWVKTLPQLEELGRKHDAADPQAYERIARAIAPERLATLIYTSGTTGQPKGVELTHDCWLFEGEAIDSLGLLREDDLQYLWLPLAHSFGKVLEVAQLRIGFESVVDGRVPKLVENLAVVRPTFMAAAPRIFEKVHNKVVANAAAGGKLKQTIFTWAMGVGRAATRRRLEGKGVGLSLALRERLANRLVFSKLKTLFGGRLRFFVSGSAPLARDIGEFFLSAGVPIYEGYGLTESSAASFVNVPANFALGTVGAPLKGVEIRIAEDGEVLIRGRGIMRGYWKLPEETKAALTDDRWLRTGDIGELDDKGRLRITDRKKDLIKTSNGKYVAPQALEGRLKALTPYVSQVVVHGDARNFCSALITLDDETIKGWQKERGLEAISAEERAKHPDVVALIQNAINVLNEQVARHETIKKFSILPTDLSVEAGELTPSLKVKRKVVEKRHKSVLDSMYARAD